jgi:uncharacterized RDD family membrane protein YckC
MKQAGFGTRVLNFVVDTIVVFLISFASIKGYNFYVLYYGMLPLNFGWFFFGTMVVYYFVLEALFSRTVGKWLTYSKVVNLQHQKPSIGAILLRSIARIIILDSFFIPFLDKTLHDYLSKTQVVQA